MFEDAWKEYYIDCISFAQLPLCVFDMDNTISIDNRFPHLESFTIPDLGNKVWLPQLDMIMYHLDMIDQFNKPPGPPKFVEHIRVIKDLGETSWFARCFPEQHNLEIAAQHDPYTVNVERDRSLIQCHVRMVNMLLFQHLVFLTYVYGSSDYVNSQLKEMSMDSQFSLPSLFAKSKTNQDFVVPNIETYRALFDEIVRDENNNNEWFVLQDVVDNNNNNDEEVLLDLMKRDFPYMFDWIFNDALDIEGEEQYGPSFAEAIRAMNDNPSNISYRHHKTLSTTSSSYGSEPDGEHSGLSDDEY
eukprot:GILJ01009411.1.p1 GENE.GILJ01009411.1~~GILJ01009411.1.p1  ORF type:complete len:334 (+),score=51.45 GILJ01009411.1:101-1003(+)